MVVTNGHRFRFRDEYIPYLPTAELPAISNDRIYCYSVIQADADFALSLNPPKEWGLKVC